MKALSRAAAAGALAAALALGVPTVSAASGPAGSASADAAVACAAGVPVGPAGAAFYTPPAPLPHGRHGDLIWADAVTAPPRAHACRILYLSTLHDGAPVAVSGIVVWPDGSGPAAGRDVVAWAHGTVGGPRQCAPSAAAKPAVNLVDYFTFDSSLGIDVGVPALTDLLAQGDVVVGTDSTRPRPAMPRAWSRSSSCRAPTTP